MNPKKTIGIGLSLISIPAFIASTTSLPYPYGLGLGAISVVICVIIGRGISKM